MYALYVIGRTMRNCPHSWAVEIMTFWRCHTIMARPRLVAARWLNGEIKLQSVGAQQKENLGCDVIYSERERERVSSCVYLLVLCQYWAAGLSVLELGGHMGHQLCLLTVALTMHDAWWDITSDAFQAAAAAAAVTPRIKWLLSRMQCAISNSSNISSLVY